MKIENISFLLVLLFFLSILKICTATDVMNTTQILRDGETLVSSGGNFVLGFLSLGNSRNRYLGIWYKKVVEAVWVANRETPLRSTSGILKFMEHGKLVLMNDINNIIWSLNVSNAENPILQLLDSGNLVLRVENDERPENFLWQSFDYLTDTFIPGMNLGWDYGKGVESYLSSWKTNEDPARGVFTLHLDPTGYPQFIMKRGSATIYRMGTWNGVRFSGAADVRGTKVLYGLMVMNQNKTYYREDAIDGSVMWRITLSQFGVLQRLAVSDQTNEWVIQYAFLQDYCDTYNSCGAYGICNIINSPPCECLNGFLPKYPEDRIKRDWSSGCTRRTPLTCHKDNAFWKYSGVKLPDSQNSSYKESMTLEECKLECLKNCSCMAYTQLDISRERSGCLFWSGDLIDIKYLTVDGQEIYIRMATSEVELSKNMKRKILIWSLISLMGVVLLGLSLMLFFCKRKKEGPKGKKGSHTKDFELPVFDLSTISKATDDFAINKKLGQGGYGPVYKGMLEDGQEIAVKRLSKTSKQGLQEFKNEVMCIAKLQHRNLVKLLGCCMERDENMLVYEYMPNKSLDFILFDQTKSLLLDWPKRFHIINGIARGLMYLHQDSRMRIIHRDVKASNILLDADMNPRISDFGMARSFGGNETEAKTRTVVGTHGYMSPEYVVDGVYSLKSDVFSFGVLVLEIVSGKKNWRFSHSDHDLNLLGHAWILFKEGRSEELADDYETADLQYLSQVLRSIHVGLLCVQKSPGLRPRMSEVVSMLENEGQLPKAEVPGFFTERDLCPAESSTTANAPKSINEVTISLPEGR